MLDDGQTRAAAGGDTVDDAEQQGGAHRGPAVLVTTRSDWAELSGTPEWKAEMVRTGRVIVR
jgi:hypothetical protein